MLLTRLAVPVCVAAPQEPFSILPLEALCDDIQSTVGELNSTHNGTAQAQGSGSSSVLPAAALVQQALELPPAFPPSQSGAADGGSG